MDNSGSYGSSNGNLGYGGPGLGYGSTGYRAGSSYGYGSVAPYDPYSMMSSYKPYRVQSYFQPPVYTSYPIYSAPAQTYSALAPTYTAPAPTYTAYTVPAPFCAPPVSSYVPSYFNPSVRFVWQLILSPLWGISE